MSWKMFALASAAIMAGLSIGCARAEEPYSYATPRESHDWCTITIRTKPANGRVRPLVLLIGDSIAVRYSAEVAAALEGQAYVSVLGTSKAVGDPALLDEIKLVLRQNAYDVIHFNFGLHGCVEGYRKGFADVIATLRRYAPNAKIVWATTTPCRQEGGGPDKGVREKNEIAAEHIVKAALPVDDLYALVAKHPTQLWDEGGVHYTAEGTALQSQQVAQSITSVLPWNVLLIGNSQCPTIVSNRILENLAASDPGRRPIKVGGCVKNGASLKSHWEAGAGPDTARGMIASGAWDVVVLQDIYTIQDADFPPFARQYHELIQKAGGRTVLFGTASILSDYPAGFERLHRIHFAMGQELDAPIVDASRAYIKYFGDHPSTERMESLFAKDRQHPGLWGCYIYACGIYSVITERSPIGLAAPKAIPADAAKSLQEAAWSQYQETTAALRLKK